jgi:voltage-gated potassium channel
MDARSRQWEKRLEWPVFMAALLVIPVIVIEESDVSHVWKTIGNVLNWLIWMVFAFELVALLAVAPSKSLWLRRHPLEVAIVVLTPPFLPPSLQALRVFRLFRVLRLLRLAQMMRRLFSVEGLRDAAIIVLVTALGGGAAFAAVEHGYSTWDGVWWAVTTMTTVGYGDLSPHTTLGRVIGIAVMLVGIGFIALLTGAIAQRFIAERVEEELELVEAEVAGDVAAARAELLRELRSVRQRLQDLESIAARIGT